MPNSVKLKKPCRPSFPHPQCTNHSHHHVELSREVFLEVDVDEVHSIVPSIADVPVELVRHSQAHAASHVILYLQAFVILNNIVI